MTKRSIFSTIVFVLIVSLGSFTSITANAAEYPPSVETPEIGDPLISPVNPLGSCEVIVPVVTSENPAKAKLTSAKSRNQISNFPSLINNSSFASGAYQAKSNLVIGGVSKSKLTSIPLATSATKSCVEVQIPQNTPVRIALTKLVKNTQYTIKIGKTVVGRINSNTKGRVSLPVFSITSFPQNYNIYVERAGTSRKVVLRTTR